MSDFELAVREHLARIDASLKHMEDQINQLNRQAARMLEELRSPTPLPG